MHRDKLALFITLFVLISISHTAYTQSQDAVCKTQLDVPARPVVDEVIKPDTIYSYAESSDVIEGGIYRLEGNAEVTRNSQQLRADVIEYDRGQEAVDVKGNVNYWDNDIYLRGQSAQVNLDDQSARMNDTEYRILTNRGRGRADELYVVADKLSVGKGVDYTTCDPDGDDPSLTTNTWKMSAREITLDHEKNWGTARNVVFRIKDIPVFYTPYMTFPLDSRRKSGFLSPEYGNSRRNGLEIQTPFYWNISPNMDATITPRLISDSGLMIMGEYRYLFENGSGSINAEYLPSDSNYFDRDRSYVSLEHYQSLPYNGQLNIVLNNLSDQKYLEDFGPSLDLTSLTALDRFVDLSFSGDNWKVFARIQDFQYINRSNPTALDPYKRLPQIGFNYSTPRKNRSFNFQVNSEYTNFERNETGSGLGAPYSYDKASMSLVPYLTIPGRVLNNEFDLIEPGVFNPVTGLIEVPLSTLSPFAPPVSTPNLLLPDIDGVRFDINPSVSYPVYTESTYIEPKLGIRYTAYNLDNTGPFDDTPDRLLPYASLDAGLFLERNLNLFNQDLTQTLEPRAYYLYVPYEDQEELPIFDTGFYDDSFDSLFYENRFSGIDRFNDANRLTLSLTSRLINSGGRELGHLKIGQIYYFDEQDVSLPFIVPPVYGHVLFPGNYYSPDRDYSPLVFELGTSLSPDWKFKAGWQWEPDDNNLQKIDLQASYRPASGKVFNIAYRVRDALPGVIRTQGLSIEQTDVSFRWPLASNWNAVGRWVYALEQGKSLDIFGGIEYDSCCWGLRIVGRRFVSNVEGDVQTGIFMQFELKGLAGIGRKTVDFLNQNIPGYTREF